MICDEIIKSLREILRYDPYSTHANSDKIAMMLQNFVKDNDVWCIISAYLAEYLRAIRKGEYYEVSTRMLGHILDLVSDENTNIEEYRELNERVVELYYRSIDKYPPPQEEFNKRVLELYREIVISLFSRHQTLLSEKMLRNKQITSLLRDYMRFWSEKEEKIFVKPEMLLDSLGVKRNIRDKIAPLIAGAVGSYYINEEVLSRHIENAFTSMEFGGLLNKVKNELLAFLGSGLGLIVISKFLEALFDKLFERLFKWGDKQKQNKK